jgi:hypothetical protein
MILLLLRLCGIPEQRLPQKLHGRTGKVWPVDFRAVSVLPTVSLEFSVTNEILE